MLRESPYRKKTWSRNRTLYLASIVLVYWTNIIIWLLSESNELIDVLNYEAETIAYFVTDIVMVYVVLFALIWMLFQKTKHTKIVYMNHTSHRQIKNTTPVDQQNQKPRNVDRERGYLFQ